MMRTVYVFQGTVYNLASRHQSSMIDKGEAAKLEKHKRSIDQFLMHQTFEALHT